MSGWEVWIIAFGVIAGFSYVSLIRMVLQLKTKLENVCLKVVDEQRRVEENYLRNERSLGVLNLELAELTRLHSLDMDRLRGLMHNREALARLHAACVRAEALGGSTMMEYEEASPTSFEHVLRDTLGDE